MNTTEQNDKQKPVNGIVNAAVTEQVLSVTISRRNVIGRFSEGINLLIDFGFSEIGDSQSGHSINVGKSHAYGKAPNDGANMFVILEYSSSVKTYIHCVLYLIHRGTKRIIDDTLMCRFAPDCDGIQKIYSVTSNRGVEWEIVTTPAPQNVLDKIALFVEGKTRISTDNTIELVENVDENRKNKFMTGRPGPVEKLIDLNSKFAVFVNENCNGDTSVTNVSDTINNHIERKNISVKKFAKDMVKEEHIQIIYYLTKLKKLHPELKPHLNMTQLEAIAQGKQILRIEVGAVLAQFDPEDQLEVWKQLEQAGSKSYKLGMARRIWREYKHSEVND